MRNAQLKPKTDGETHKGSPYTSCFPIYR